MSGWKYCYGTGRWIHFLLGLSYQCFKSEVGRFGCWRTSEKHGFASRIPLLCGKTTVRETNHTFEHGRSIRMQRTRHSHWGLSHPWCFTLLIIWTNVVSTSKSKTMKFLSQPTVLTVKTGSISDHITSFEVNTDSTKTREPNRKDALAAILLACIAGV